MRRHDFAFPFRIDPSTRAGEEAASYEEHVRHMIRQVLLTSPGERTHLPSFGAGLRRLLFAPPSQGVAATAELLVTESLKRWLSEHLQVKRVAVKTADDGAPENTLSIRVDYVLLETRTPQAMEISFP